MFDATQAVAWVRRTAAVIEEHASELTKLDAAIGDGDHGTNLARGFRTVLQRLDALPDDPTIAAVFKAVSMALIGKVGGAAGPLYGTFYLAMGRSIGDQTEVDDAAVAAGLRAGLDGVLARGKAQLEDKTMVDAIHPALEALDAALADGKDLGAALDAAEAAARKGVAATIPLVARKGRASYLGERSRDHQDPGATSSHLILEVLADVVNGR
jgi:dihydroxyacetone kinase-like protein